jgi:4-hydroxybenzoate polyprenyltransferase
VQTPESENGNTLTDSHNGLTATLPREIILSPIKHPPIIGQIPYMLMAMRIKQWSKNGLVLLALIFAERLTDLLSDERTLLAFLAFSFAASTIYIINDIGDRAKDRLHPKKRKRPIASGNLSIPMAIATIIICMAAASGAIAGLVLLPKANSPDPYASLGDSTWTLGGVIALYIGINLAYTYWLKHQVLWDVFTVAAGFVMRAFVGALAIPVPISPWFYLCTLFLALFLALGKRRAEIVNLTDRVRNYRAILQQYNLVLLDQLMCIVATCTLVSYCLYTFLGTRGLSMMVTIPFVIFGLFRYLYLVYVKSEGDRPDEVLWSDRQIMLSVACCVIVAIIILYGIPWYGHHRLSIPF